MDTNETVFGFSQHLFSNDKYDVFHDWAIKAGWYFLGSYHAKKDDILSDNLIAYWITPSGTLVQLRVWNHGAFVWIK